MAPIGFKAYRPANITCMPALPPAQKSGESYPDNIVPPEDASGNPFNADTDSIPNSLGTRDLTQATVVSKVSAGNGSPRESAALCNSAPRPAITYCRNLGLRGPDRSPFAAAGHRKPAVSCIRRSQRDHLLHQRRLRPHRSGPPSEPRRLSLKPWPTTAPVMPRWWWTPGPLPAASNQAAQVAQQVALVVTLPTDMYTCFRMRSPWSRRRRRRSPAYPAPWTASATPA